MQAQYYSYRSLLLFKLMKESPLATRESMRLLRALLPVLGILGVLLRNEWFKTRKRLAFWLALGFFSFITFMNHAQGFFESDEDFALPQVWGSVFGQDMTFTARSNAVHGQARQLAKL